ncbi:hypothetical protein EW146_g669 [Bondarzewia mesenterica]|uniref:Uncharacterized protein n=1 Tax=Bondarzewia mesenterica TaxID=1095465 RepID=A0A4S4M641_9AGAM|nr:hypothetical protein EW146_g669 [Bondarzewia mesenterica]
MLESHQSIFALQRMQIDSTPEQPGSEDDVDSLFGSPPPSPARGRSPQLALPTGPSSAENVGTIALPGSQSHSELPLNPAVLLLSSLSPHTATHSPSPTPTASTSTQSQILSRTGSVPPRRTSATSSRASSRAPAPKKSKKGKQRSATPRPPPPPMHLPDPDEPPPPNFLRNQQALLGLAGLVGGVNPANLSKRNTQGSNANNPIVIEDVTNQPRIGKSSRYTVDASQLPPPSGDAILKTLVKQKNLFAVLESLLQLISRSNAASTSGQVRKPIYTPPTDEGPEPPSGKRRKLNRVPAGAADWDVPYPFQRGEGPEQYRAQWEKQRLKQLLAQLAGIVQGATRSAATKSYLQQSWTEAPSGFDSQTQSYLYPASRSASPWTVDEIANVATPPPIVHPDANLHTQPHPEPSQTTPFDQFLSSLLDSSSSSTSSNTVPFTTTPGPASAPTDNNTPTDEFVAADFENFLAMLNDPDTYSMVGLNPPDNAFPQSTSSIDTSVTHETISTSSTNNFIPDFMIDPILMALSNPDSTAIQQPSPSQSGPLINPTLASPTPALAPSPIASTSSLADPLTPQWDEPYTEPEIYRGEQGMFRSHLNRRPPMFRRPSVVNDQMVQMVPAAPHPPPTSSLPQQQQSHAPAQTPEHVPMPTTYRAPQLNLNVLPAATQPLITPISRPAFTPARSPSTISTQAPSAVPALTSTARLLSVLDPRLLSQHPLANGKSQNKQETIRRARERRQQLVAELERAKVELWETTIEQGVLAHLLKDSSLS